MAASDAVRSGGKYGNQRAEEEDSAKKNTGKVFVGGLDMGTSKDELVEHCARWGRVVDAVIFAERGFGFVTFATDEEREAFLSEPSHELRNKRLECKRAFPKGLDAENPEAPPYESRIFVGGIPYDSDEAALRSTFERFGHIEAAEIATDPSGNSRGFGFVTFSAPSSVPPALEADLSIAHRRLLVRRAFPKDALPKSSFDNRFSGSAFRRKSVSWFFFLFPFFPFVSLLLPFWTNKNVFSFFIGARPGDWDCPRCQEINFAFRDECRRCGLHRASAVASGPPQPPQAFPDRQALPGNLPQPQMPDTGPSSGAPGNRLPVQPAGPMQMGVPFQFPMGLGAQPQQMPFPIGMPATAGSGSGGMMPQSGSSAGGDRAKERDPRRRNRSRSRER